jgi:tetratricopeptide (TPR) repeat protein
MGAMHRCNDSLARAVALAVFALALSATPAGAQELRPRVTRVELTPHLAVNDAATLVEAEDYAGAIEMLDTFVANQPEPVPEAFYLLGIAHYQLGDFAKALPAAERAATLARDAPASWLELVVALLKQREDARATVPWLERLVEMAPDHKVYWLELSLAYEKISDYARALATMRLAHAAGLLSADADFRRLSDLLVHQGLPQQGAEVLDRALADQIVAADEAAYTKLGTAWFRAGEPDRAVLPLENAARIASSGDAHVRLAIVHVDRQDWTAAIAALHAGMGRGSLTDTGRANLLMGVALYAQGKFDEARDWLTMAAEEEAHRGAANSYLEAIEARTSASNRTAR